MADTTPVKTTAKTAMTVSSIVVALVAFCSPIPVRANAETKEPFVFYSAQSNWDGYPLNRNVSGWNVVLTRNNIRGANTGIMAFIMRWDAKKKCWGMDRDCRPPSWAVSQHMAYIGTVQANSLFLDIKQ